MPNSSLKRVCHSTAQDLALESLGGGRRSRSAGMVTDLIRLAPCPAPPPSTLAQSVATIGTNLSPPPEALGRSGQGNLHCPAGTSPSVLREGPASASQGCRASGLSGRPPSMCGVAEPDDGGLRGLLPSARDGEDYTHPPPPPSPWAGAWVDGETGRARGPAASRPDKERVGLPPSLRGASATHREAWGGQVRSYGT